MADTDADTEREKETFTRKLQICLEVLQKKIHLCDAYEKDFVAHMSKKSRSELNQLNDAQKIFLQTKAHEIAFRACLDE